MDLQLTNKKTLVTGSTAGIGFAIASLLAEEGASVVVNGRSQQRVDDAVPAVSRNLIQPPSIQASQSRPARP